MEGGLAAQAKADMRMFVDELHNDNNEPEKSKKSKAPKEPKVTFAPSETLVPPVEDEIEQKATVIRKIVAYMREFGDRLDGIKLGTKQTLSKMTLEETKMLLADVEHELGKAGALDICRGAFVNLCEGVEKFQARTKILPYDLTNYGKIATISANDYQLPDGSIQHGHMIPLLKEFSIKYSDWFSSRVEIRILIQMQGMMAECHRINTEAPEVAKKASQKKTQKATAAAAKGL